MDINGDGLAKYSTYYIRRGDIRTRERTHTIYIHSIFSKNI